MAIWTPGITLQDHLKGIRTIFYGRRTLRSPKIGPDKKKTWFLAFFLFFLGHCQITFFSSDNHLLMSFPLIKPRPHSAHQINFQKL